MKFFIELFAVIIAIIVLWKVNYPSGTWRYKITVEIETPEGIKIGSAVRQINAHTNPKITPEMHSVDYDVSGEAVVVNLGNRGLLFALINMNSWMDVSYSFPRGSQNQIEFYSNLSAGTKAVLKKEFYPEMIKFEDINKPNSAKLVYKFGQNRTDDYFKSSFGDDVKIKQIIIEMTNDPVTFTIQNWLAWTDQNIKMFEGLRYGLPT